MMYEHLEYYLRLESQAAAMTTPDDHPRPVKTTQTAAAIVDFLKRESGATLSELSEHLDVARSTAHRHLRTLIEEEWVRHEESTGEYRVSLNLFHIGTTVREEHPVYEFAKDRVDELANRTNERAWCIVEDGGRGIHLYGASDSPVETYARVGARTYLHQHAAGKSILAFRPRNEVDSIVDEHGLPAITEKTVTERTALFEELDEIEERGYALNREESFRGLHAVGVPICDDAGEAVGAVSISGPANRLDGEVLESELPEILLEVTNEIEINMSYADGEGAYPED